MGKMTVERMCEILEIPFEIVEGGCVSEEKEAMLKQLFEQDEAAFFQMLRKEKAQYQIALYLYMKWAAESYETYKEKGLSDAMFFDNYKDMSIWYQKCLKETGIHGMKQYEWTALPIKGKIYRLGRLQFEMTKLREDVSVERIFFPKGTRALEVHIPEGEPLLEEKVQESFIQAEYFFHHQIPYNYHLFFCESWLLSTKLQELLPQKSNILKFAKLFTVYKEVEAKQAEERVFGCVKERPEEYEAITSLQKQLKQYMINGGSVGMGHGIIITEAAMRNE